MTPLRTGSSADPTAHREDGGDLPLKLDWKNSLVASESRLVSGMDRPERARPGLGPFVGRKRELGELTQALDALWRTAMPRSNKKARDLI